MSACVCGTATTWRYGPTISSSSTASALNHARAPVFAVTDVPTQVQIVA